MQTEVRVTFRMPVSVHAFLSAEAAENFTSINAEIVRAVRERMDREAKSASEGGATPPKASPEA